jgi:hypothetical protein
MNCHALDPYVGHPNGAGKYGRDRIGTDRSQIAPEHQASAGD